MAYEKRREEKRAYRKKQQRRQKKRRDGEMKIKEKEILDEKRYVSNNAAEVDFDPRANFGIVLVSRLVAAIKLLAFTKQPPAESRWVSSGPTESRAMRLKSATDYAEAY